MSVQAYIKDNQAALCALLQELVRIPTVNPPGENYAEMVGLLAAKCKALRDADTNCQSPKTAG